MRSIGYRWHAGHEFSGMIFFLFVASIGVSGGPDIFKRPEFQRFYSYIILYIKSNVFRFVKRKKNQLQGEGARENFPRARLFSLRGCK